jgi:hypothetical protein
VAALAIAETEEANGNRNHKRFLEQTLRGPRLIRVAFMIKLHKRQWANVCRNSSAMRGIIWHSAINVEIRRTLLPEANGRCFQSLCHGWPDYFPAAYLIAGGVDLVVTGLAANNA